MRTTVAENREILPIKIVEYGTVPVSGIAPNEPNRFEIGYA